MLYIGAFFSAIILHRLLATFPFLIRFLKYKKIGPNAGWYLSLEINLVTPLPKSPIGYSSFINI